MVVPKKNGKIRVCVDYRKLNVATVTDAFPLPFTDGVLDAVAGHEVYSFLDGFSGYNQIRMHPVDKEKTTFFTEWGVFVAVVMIFGLKMFGLKESSWRYSGSISLHFCRYFWMILQCIANRTNTWITFGCA